MLGNYSANDLIDAAFRAAEDGDCARVGKNLDAAAKAGANVEAHRKQLSRQCAGGELHGVGRKRYNPNWNVWVQSGVTGEWTSISAGHTKSEANKTAAEIRTEAAKPVPRGMRAHQYVAAKVVGDNMTVDRKTGEVRESDFRGLGRAPAARGAARCDKTVTKKGPKIHGTYCERVITPLNQLAPESIRTLVFDKGARVVVVGCPRGQWKAKGSYKGARGAGRCAVGTKAHAVLKRVGGARRAARGRKKGGA